MKLNKRLLALSEMVCKPYDIVWDCCCDHGLLGFKILTDGLVKQVNFVDLVPNIIEHLEQKLETYSHHLPADASWNIFCQDVSKLDLFEQDINIPMKYSQLVIISGVGGELIIEMLKALMGRYAGLDIDFLLCPVQHTYKLRKALIEQNFKLKQEQLVMENKRGYELILVNQVGIKALTVTGKQLWKATSVHQQYLTKLIAHYQRSTTVNQEKDELNLSALVEYKAIYQQHYSSRN